MQKAEALYYVYTDGGARGNPGPAAIGVVIKDYQGKLVYTMKRVIGNATNNVAEYTAIIGALSSLLNLSSSPKKSGEIHCFLDSELVVRQLNGVYKVKNKAIRALFIKAQKELEALADRGYRVLFLHIPREQNTQADQLVNDALDKQVRQE